MMKNIILIVDDNPLNLKLLDIILTAKNYDVHCATTAEEALTLLTDLTPDLILMDIQLPGMDGLTLTRQLKADPKYKDIKIVAVTAYAMQGDKEKILAAGCDGYIAKPINTRTFVDTISEFIKPKST